MICFDTSILIWGLQGETDPTQPDMPERARRYIEALTAQKERIMVPAPVIHEFLTKIPMSNRGLIIERLSNLFFVPPFDLPAAILAAELDSDRNEIKVIRREHSKSNQKIKVDTQIIAIAIMHKATEIVTGEYKYFQKIAKGRIRVISLPDVSTQESILGHIE